MGRSVPTPIDCTVCGITLSRKSDLRRHMDLHDPIKEKLKHPCPHPGCTYKARQRNNLKTHMNTHTGERPHKCTEVGCDFSTGDPGSLARHRRGVHGQEPKENSRSCRSATTDRKETRRQRKTAPYPSLSPTSTDRSTESASPFDPSLEVSGTPTPEASSILDQTASLPPPAGSRVDGRDIKNAFAAYNTELIPKYPQVNDPIVAPDAQTQESFHPRSGLTTEAKMLVDGYSQLPALEQIQQGSLSTFDQLLLAEPLPEGGYPLDVTTDALFENFLSQFDHMQGTGASTLSHIIPPVQYPIYDPPASLPVPLLPSYEEQYSVNDTYLPTPATLSTYENSYAPVESAPYEQYSYPTKATSFDAPYSYPFSSAASDMSSYTQAPYQTYSYHSTPVEMSDLQMEGSSFH